MSRRKRSYLAGGVFHITARTHCKEHYFTPAIRDAIVSIIARALPRSDALLIAYAIMANHYHLIVRQGIAPLAQLIQAVNREIALAVQRDQRRKGYVFERRFRDKMCLNADQLREWITYTHRNPVRAGLCDDPAGWAWSSHGLYLGRTAVAGSPVVHPALELFADEAGDDEGCQGYLRYVTWRAECDALPTDAIRPPQPLSRFGDDYFAKRFARAPLEDLTPLVDLRDVALRALEEVAPNLTLQDLWQLPTTRASVQVRRHIIRAALRARHRRKDIAVFLNVSDSTVSRVATTLAPRPVVRFDN